MSADQIFFVSNFAVMPAWLLLAFAPRWSVTQRVVQALWLPGLIAVAYLYAFLLAPGSPEGAGFGTLAGLSTMFAVPEVMLAGWLHYLAFDLFVGCWETRDAERLGIPHLLVIPCLFLTLMLGPVGLLLYGIVRAVARAEVGFERPVPGTA